jgi:hypothetical protein
MDGLQRLEESLSHYPAGFFEAALGDMEEGILTLCLVRSLRGSPESGSMEQADGIQFWENDDSYVALALGDTLERTLYHEMYHVLESRLLSESIACYRWDELNPKGFDYDYDYIANQSRDGSEYLRSQDRSFVDTESMSFPQEDRARIFRYAMDDQLGGAYFTTVTMQEKLTAICKGIREAYGWKQSGEVFPWEQYLEKPLAKTK